MAKPRQGLVCDSCHSKIEHIARILILQDIDYGPIVLFTHFFYPCWDLGLLCKKYPHLCIQRLGFSIPKQVLVTNTAKEQFKQNLGFWV